MVFRLWYYSPLAEGMLTGKVTLSNNNADALRGTRFEVFQDNTMGMASRTWSLWMYGSIYGQGSTRSVRKGLPGPGDDKSETVTKIYICLCLYCAQLSW
ncbi:hypothetical protein F4818DRAFT_395178 [Hypoxylon cercidicola]|nr:hypothetical protein F4818DRAFT_395178 [Hypoxylon cercidicola]